MSWTRHGHRSRNGSKNLLPGRDETRLDRRLERETMIRKFGQRTAVAVAVAVVAASGSVLFGATALADGHGSNHFSGGSGGKGGTAQSWCLIPIAAGLGV